MLEPSDVLQTFTYPMIWLFPESMFRETNLVRIRPAITVTTRYMTIIPMSIPIIRDIFNSCYCEQLNSKYLRLSRTKSVEVYLKEVDKSTLLETLGCSDKFSTMEFGFLTESIRNLGCPAFVATTAEKARQTSFEIRNKMSELKFGVPKVTARLSF